MKAGFLIILLCISVSYVLADAFLSSWLHNLLPVLGQRTIYQLALPGTTQDLDLIISEGGIDDENALAEVLHVASELGILPRAALEFVRRQARTQPLTLTQQLDAGVRFVDFRMMRTDKNWRSLHMLQTKQLASVYMQELHAWMVAHPSEVGMKLSQFGYTHHHIQIVIMMIYMSQWYCGRQSTVSHAPREMISTPMLRKLRNKNFGLKWSRYSARS
jgi:hypothetical protein